MLRSKQMFLRKYFIEIVLGSVVVACLAYLLIKMWNPPRGDMKNCVPQEQSVTVNDDWMKGEWERGATVIVITNWRECLDLKPGDRVAYKVSAAHDPVIRILAAQGGDTFKLHRTDNELGWTIEINGEIFGGADTPYVFGTAAPPALKLFEAAHQGHLDQGSVLLFSKISPGAQDSGSLGVLSVNDIVGVVKPR